MCSWIVPPIRGLIEPTAVPDIYVDKTGAVEVVGSCVRFYLAAQQHPLEVMDGELPHYVVVGKLVIPTANIPGAIAQLATCLAPEDLRHVGKGPWTPRIVS